MMVLTLKITSAEVSRTNLLVARDSPLPGEDSEEDLDVCGAAIIAFLGACFRIRSLP
jgi:hypothetical protein